MFWVYILKNPTGKFYIGQTDDLQRRLIEHNNPESATGKYTHKHGPGNWYGQKNIKHVLMP